MVQWNFFNGVRYVEYEIRNSKNWGQGRNDTHSTESGTWKLGEKEEGTLLS